LRPLIALLLATFVVTSGVVRAGVLRSATAAADTWQSIGLAGSDVVAIAATPTTVTTLYASVLNTGLFRSTDDGTTWNAINVGIPVSPVLVTIALHPTTPTTLLVGGNGVFRSSNRGDSWNPSSTGIPDKAFTRALVYDTTALNTVYAGTEGSGVYRSSDAGMSWVAVNNGLANAEVRALAITPTTPPVLYAGTAIGVYRSDNAGVSWSSARSGLPSSKINTLAIDPLNPQVLYAGTAADGMYRSLNGGTSWSAINTGLPPSERINALALQPQQTTVYAATRGNGVYRSTNAGESWSAFNDGIPNQTINTLAVNPKTPVAVYAGTETAGAIAVGRVPVLQPNIDTGAPGSAFLFQGVFFPPGSTLTVAINGTALTQTVAVGADGRCSFLLTTALAAQPGFYRVTATTSDASGASFYRLVADAQVQSAPPDAPAPIAVPTSIEPLQFNNFVPVVRR
jgi:photosystem II stability/assembly factor-like uncharacterized protein